MVLRLTFQAVCALACLGALAVVAGSVSAPSLPPGVTYDVVIPANAILETPADIAAGTGSTSVSSPLAGFVATGNYEKNTWLLIGVFVVWLLVAGYFMDGAFATVAGLGGISGVAALYLGIGGGTAEAVSRTVPAAPSVLRPIAVLGLILAFGTGTVALLLPGDHPVRRRGGDIFARLRREIGGSLPELRPGSSASLPDDEVYRAWVELAREIDASPTDTPGEVVAAARNAGYPESAVQDLQVAFEATRYGGQSLSDDEIRHAAAAIDELAADPPGVTAESTSTGSDAGASGGTES